MTEIVLITPPDMLYNQSFKLMLLCPSDQLKEQINAVLLGLTESINVLYYDSKTDDIEWAVNAANLSDMIIFDTDNAGRDIKEFASYFISLNKTFYLTNNNKTAYNLISKNRIYDLVWFEEYLLNRGKNEKR
jgi:hypothetical protein